MYETAKETLMYRTLFWTLWEERLGAGGEGDDRGWDGLRHHRYDGHDFEWTPGVGDGLETWRAAIHGVTKSQTRVSDWTELNEEKFILNWCYKHDIMGKFFFGGFSDIF